MNEVTIDESRLAAEADAALAAAPVIEGAPGADAAPALQSWAPIVGSAIPMLRIGVFPQWDVSDDEWTEFRDSLGQCLDQLFPGGIAGPYACYVRFALVCIGVTAKQVIVGGKLPPLWPRRAVQQKDKPGADPAAH